MDAEAATGLANKKNQFKCIVPGCGSSTRSNIAKLHSFPWRDMPRAQKWIHAVGSLELLGAPPKALLRLRVCDLHFDKKLKRGKNMKLFDNNAVPTLKLGSVKTKNTKVFRKLPKKKKVKKVKLVNKEPNETPDPVAETAANGTSGTNGTAGGTPTPIRLPRELTRFLSLREKMQKKNTARKGYDHKFSVYALNLYLASPSAYRVLWKSLRLPPPRLLARAHVGVGTRVDADLVQCLHSKLEKLEVEEKECVLCIDEVELTKKLFYAIDKDEIVGLEEIGSLLRVAAAARAVVLVARAVRGLWTQPLGYFYLADDTDVRELVAPLRKLVVQVLQGRLGCRVLAVVSALGPTFAQLADALRVTVESPLALDANPRQRVAFLHDPEQLALTLRDTLIMYDIKFVDAASGASLRASWRHVTALQRADAARAQPLLPELTRACVEPSPRQSLRPQLALAVFSRRVAAQLAAHAGADSKGAAGTARLLQLAAACLRALRAPRPRALAAVTRAADALCSSLCDMRIVAADGAEYDAEVFVRSLQVSLAGALQLLAERPPQERDAPLRLARCGLRPLRAFIARAEGARGRLAPQDFRARFRRWTMRHLLAPAERGGARRGDDLAGLLLKAEDEAAAAGGARRGVAAGGLQHRVDMSRRCDLQYAAAALQREMRRAHGCADFVRWAAQPERIAGVVRLLDLAFKKLFEKKVVNAVGALALRPLGAVLLAQMPCACFPRDTFCRLFVRFRIRAALLAHNRALRGVARPGEELWLLR